MCFQNWSHQKIITTKIDMNNEISNKDCEEIIKIFNLNESVKTQAISLIKSIYQMFINTDANMVEVNPLILTKEEKVICLDAKVNFDSNALFRHPEIVELRDLNEEDPAEIGVFEGMFKARCVEGAENAIFIAPSKDVTVNTALRGQTPIVVKGSEAELFMRNTLYKRIFEQKESIVLLGNEDGDLLVLDHGKDKPKVESINMGAPVYSSPVYVNGTLYIATQTHLYAIGE